MNEHQLEFYFKNDKSDWHSIALVGQELYWEEDKVNEFWYLIREHKIKKEDYNFEDFTFPSFNRVSWANRDMPKQEENFWQAGQQRIFNKEVSFKNAKFLGNVDFSLVHFEDKVNFDYSSFNEEAFFMSSIFYKEAFFESVTFLSDASFHSVRVEDDIHFLSTKFEKGLDLSLAILESAAFNYVQIEETLLCFNTTFKSAANFSDCSIDSVKFSYLNRNMGYINHKLKETNPSLIFVNINFSKNSVFEYVDFHKIEFENCDLSECKFYSCSWYIRNSRLILPKEKEPVIFVENPSIKDINARLNDSEQNYRQLKRNFESEKNWELSGFCYVSEMEMRKKRLWNEKQYFDWFVYWFYGFFGGYTQDYKKPVVSLALLILISSIIFFFIDYNFIRALQRGIKGALPYININFENPFNDNWLIIRNIEFILSGTFLTFFILALRKRFKQ